jgi:hypothetical protein
LSFAVFFFHKLSLSWSFFPFKVIWWSQTWQGRKLRTCWRWIMWENITQN